MKKTKIELEFQLIKLNHERDKINQYIVADSVPFDSLLKDIEACNKNLFQKEIEIEAKRKRNELILSDLRSQKSSLAAALQCKVKHHNELDKILIENYNSIQICKEEIKENDKNG